MARLLQAVGEVISERGVNRVGINAVAEKAGVNKVLIYRYFGGWEGLLQQFLTEGNFLTDYNKQFLDTNTEAAPSPCQIRIDYLKGLLRQLKNHPPAQEMLKWEISSPSSALSQQLVLSRNESYQKVLDKFFQSDQEDLNAVTALLTSGIAMLLLIAPSQKQFMDLNLQSEESWKRIEHAIGRIYNSLQ
ncbi:TetR family transcriptional regulator [Larkinella arboricola]|uniref:TetR family transcriptional regulator n=1 Tax=Larkinella arboricola TaxID=643671 RepID=A0A327X2G2_LARAB|nr:TetR/AcrR family transcriptional regulator [Larkinella arboricola]RAJ99848.1 TetR family transcriptional regulator [Larkinella arboricola]